MDPQIRACWARFLDSAAARALPRPALYDVMRIGTTPESMSDGAALILSGRKTATSSRPQEYPDRAAWPFVGALSIVVDGADHPVAVVETTEVTCTTIAGLDAAFARDYGEWDGSAEGLKAALSALYACAPDQMLICERFRVIFRQDGARP